MVFNKKPKKHNSIALKYYFFKNNLYIAIININIYVVDKNLMCFIRYKALSYTVINIK